MNEQCPICRSAGVRDAGPVYHPVPAKVAGVPIDLGDMSFRMLECGSCGFAFKRPLIPSERLLKCYSEADPGNWALDPDPIRRRFDTLFEIMRRHAPTSPRPLRVLDVGCSNGAMLKYFGDSCERYGVDPGAKPSQLAAQRGIHMLGDTIDKVHGRDGFFDVILAIDVIEHINDPLFFFQSVARLLKPGAGIFIAMTGDRDALSFRLQGSLYWYVSSLPEHVAFWNQKSVAAAGRACGMTSIEHTRLSHRRAPMSDWSIQALKNLVFACLNRGRFFGIPAVKRVCANRAAPNFIAACDHMVCVLRRGA